MQSTADEEDTPLVITFMDHREEMVHTLLAILQPVAITFSFMQPLRPFELVLLWDPKEVAEQICIIDSTLFCRISGECVS